MISDKVIVADKGDTCAGLEEALAMVQKSAEYNGFAEGQVDTLKRLANELIDGSAAILNVFTGTLWTQTKDDMFQILLEMEGSFDPEKREEFIAFTKDNKNTMPDGFFAKLGTFLSDALTGGYFYPYGMESDPVDAEIMWSNAEITRILQEAEQKTPEDKQTEKQAKYILDAEADDIEVQAHANYVLITVSKKLPTKR